MVGRHHSRVASRDKQAAAQLLRQATCLQASRGQNAAAMPASRGLKHETCFLTDATNPPEDEGTSDLIHVLSWGKRRLEPQFSRDLLPKTWRP